MDAQQRSPFCHCLYFAANALARSMTNVAAKFFAPLGLSPSHAFVLLAAAAKPGIAAGELAQQMQLKPSTVTRLLDSLEQRGLLRRSVLGRSLAVHLTSEGLKLAGLAKAAWHKLYERYVALLGEAPARQLTEQVYAAHELIAGSRSVNTRKKIQNRGET